MEDLYIEVVLSSKASMIATIQITSPLVEKIKSTQFQNPELVKLKESVEEERIKDFELVNGVLRFREKLYVPNVEEIKKDMLCEAHHSVYDSHPGGTKMYHDLKENY